MTNLQITKIKESIPNNYRIYFNNGCSAYCYFYGGKFNLNSVESKGRTYFLDKFKVVQEVSKFFNQYANYSYNWDIKVYEVSNELKELFK